MFSYGQTLSVAYLFKHVAVRQTLCQDKIVLVTGTAIFKSSLNVKEFLM